MTIWLNVYNFMQALGFQPRDWEYRGQQIIMTQKLGYTPSVGDFVSVSDVGAAIGRPLFVYTTDTVNNAGQVIGSEVRKGDFRNTVWWLISLTLQQGQIFIE